MKKTLWMLGVAVAALTSCTESEVLDVPESRVIGFEMHVDKQTRTASAPAVQIGSKIELSKSYLLAYEGENPLFANTPLYKNANGSFTYDTHQYWHASKKYNFAAYSDGNNQTPMNIGAGIGEDNGDEVSYILYDSGNTTSSLVFKNYTASDKDLIAAIHKPIQTNENGNTDLEGNSIYVPLIFKHMLTCIQINLTNESSELFYRVEEISLTAVKTDQCTFSVDENGIETCLWSNVTKNGDDNPGNDVDTEENAYVFAGSAADEYISPSSPYNKMLFVIPQSSNIAIEIAVKVYEWDGETYHLLKPETKSSTLAIQDVHSNILPWQNGVQYKYTAQLSSTPNPIHFDVGVASWGIPTNVPLN